MVGILSRREMERDPRKSWRQRCWLDILAPSLICAALAGSYCHGIFPHLGNLHSRTWNDWDHHFIYRAVPRDTLLRFHQFPLWNPYEYGGMPLLAHPESSFLSPAFLLDLWLGPVVAPKLSIPLHLCLGLLGMYWLSRLLRLSRLAAYLPGMIFLLNSSYALHLHEGHTWYLPYAYVPYAVIFYLKALERRAWAALSGAVIALMILEGGIYPAPLTVLFLAAFSLVLTARDRSVAPAKAWLATMLWAAGGAAVKLLPSIALLSEYPRRTSSWESIRLIALPKMFFGELYENLDRIRGIVREPFWFWHEYGYYIGWVPILLLAVYLLLRFSRQGVCRTEVFFDVGVLFLVFGLGNFGPLAPWLLLHALPLFGSLHVSSRFFMMALFGFSFCCAAALDRLQWDGAAGPAGGRRKHGLVVALAILWTACDLVNHNSAVFNYTFTRAQPDVIRHAQFAQVVDRSHAPSDAPAYADMYESFMRNRGVLNAFDGLHARCAALAADDPRYRGEVYVQSGRGRLEGVRWSPNRVDIDVDMEQAGLLILNQNFYPGWRVSGQGSILNYRGLLAVEVPSGRQTMGIFYQPATFLVGAGVSLSALAGMFWVAWRLFPV